MATLTFSPIRKDILKTLCYIADGEKMCAGQFNILPGGTEAYESMARIYSNGKHCSSNPTLAAAEMALYKRLYFFSKHRAVRPHELLGLHFYISYTEADNPALQVMDEISQALSNHPLLRDFPCLYSHHLRGLHKHTHLFVGQFSAIGPPRKNCLHHNDLLELKRYVDQLCVERGLSIIDSEKLRKDPAYSAWIDDLIANKTVIVHKQRPKEQRRKRNTSTKNDYYIWLQQQATAKKEALMALPADKRRQKELEDNYFYTPIQAKGVRWYASGDPMNRFYAIPRNAKRNRRRTPLELLGYFILAVARGEGRFIRSQSVSVYEDFLARVDSQLQGFIDAIHIAQVMNIQNPADTAACIELVSKRIDVLQKELARLAPIVREHDKLFSADSAELPLHHTEAYRELYLRHEYQKRRVAEYTKRLSELCAQRDALEKLEPIMNHPVAFLNEIYAFSERAEQQTVTAIIDGATLRAKPTTPPHPQLSDKSLDRL